MIILILIPLLTLCSALWLNKHNGKRQFLRFDLVQFVYSFVMIPALFVWSKSFLFYLMKNELNLALSINQLFIFDSMFSLSFMYVYAFVVIHALTKSFQMRKVVDPLYDMFHHSEYFHLWLSHVVMFGGTMLLITLFGTFNLFFPFTALTGKGFLYMFLLLGAISGVALYAAVWLSNPLQGNFMRLMKLLFGFGFLIHVINYYLFDPSFNLTHGFFWMSLIMFATLVIASLVVHRSRKATGFIDRMKDPAWGSNIDVLSKKK